MTTYSATRVSSNSKTGPILTTITSRESCPDACGLKGSGCYAESGHVRLHWNNASKPFKQGKNGFTGGDLSQLVGEIKQQAKGSLWRMNVSGDLSHTEQAINSHDLRLIIQANTNKRGFTYTHHNVLADNNTARWNAELIRKANEAGFTINLSADNLEHADQLKALNIGPVVTILPIDADKLTHTPAGNQVVICPAVLNENITCATCGVCAVATRRTIIGFPVHGTSKAKAAKVFMMKAAKG